MLLDCGLQLAGGTPLSKRNDFVFVQTPLDATIHFRV
jgi:hypothetical protein